MASKKVRVSWFENTKCFVSKVDLKCNFKADKLKIMKIKKQRNVQKIDI